MLYYASSCSFKLLCSIRCGHAFYCSSTLTLSTVSSIVTLFFIIYTSSISKLLLLLWSLFKCLSLLESLVWPLFLWFLSIGILTSRFSRPVVAIYMLRFLCTAKIHWLQTSILLSHCLLWCFLYWNLSNVVSVGLFSLIDSVINFNYFVNQLLHILGVFYEY